MRRQLQREEAAARCGKGLLLLLLLPVLLLLSLSLSLSLYRSPASPTDDFAQLRVLGGAQNAAVGSQPRRFCLSSTTSLPLPLLFLRRERQPRRRAEGTPCPRFSARCAGDLIRVELACHRRL